MTTCRNCGRPLRDGAVFCTHCGEDLRTASPATGRRAPNRAAGIGFWLLSFVVLVMVLLGAFVACSKFFSGIYGPPRHHHPISPSMRHRQAVRTALARKGLYVAAYEVDLGNSTPIEGETLVSRAHATAGVITVQKNEYWSGGGQMLWQPKHSDQVLNVLFTVAQSGDYKVSLVLIHSRSYGVYAIELDGQPTSAPVDLYAPQALEGRRDLPLYRLKAGQHRLTFRNHGKNPSSQGYWLGLDCILLASQQGKTE